MVTKSPAADLRAGSKKTFEVGLIVSLAFAIAAFKFFPTIQPPKPIEPPDTEPPIIITPPATEHLPLPPPPARHPIVLEAPGDEPLENFVLDTDLDPNSNVPPPPPPVDGDEFYFEAVESPPVPIGGVSAIQSNVIYPEMAKRIGIQGTVVILAFVDETGTVTKAKVLKGIGFGCDEAAVKAVEKTRFHPGTQREKAVKVKVSISLKFRLQ